MKLFNLAKGGKFAEALRLYRILTPAFHLDTDVKLVQYIKLAEHLTYGASLAVRAPRLPVEGAELAHAEAVIRKTIADLAAFG